MMTCPRCNTKTLFLTTSDGKKCPCCGYIKGEVRLVPKTHRVRDDRYVRVA